ncbi:abscisic acid receptor PYL9 [Lactuca sativa]|uniref:abscisic acid receptor PYL9 n=1 Tax=Lactuca sativa TaxID=4236 RepID=UPI001C68FF99|nr:abscisic acid receptor PYL9 [Lactuca sativa]
MRLFLCHESPLTDERTSNNSCVANVFTGVCVCSLVRRFDQPQKYKPFISKCTMYGDLNIGSVRHVNVKARLPATTSTESVELLDDNEHILGIKIIGGDHNLMNYSSILTFHPEIIEGRSGTLVIESFMVDIPDGNTKDETCYFVKALINCNLNSLSEVSEWMDVQEDQRVFSTLSYVNIDVL